MNDDNKRLFKLNFIDVNVSLHTIMRIVNVDDVLPSVVRYGIYYSSVVIWSHADCVIDKS